MRKILFLFILCFFCQQAWCQNKPKRETIFSDSYLRLGTLYPTQFGNHSLSKDHDSNFGFAASLYLLHYHNFRLGGGIEFLNYSVTDKTKMGEVNNSNYSTYYFTFCYDYKLNKKFIVQPTLGYGVASINMTSINKKFTSQDGKEIRMGSYIDYRLNRSFAFFVSLHYIATIIEVNTNSDFENYFGKAQQIQIGFGFKIY
jgi:hypothetical protein